MKEGRRRISQFSCYVQIINRTYIDRREKLKELQHLFKNIFDALDIIQINFYFQEFSK